MKPTPDFDIDYAVGHRSELFVRDIREAFQTDRVECKADRRFIETGNIFVEYEQLKVREGWSPSGMSRTTAEVWTYELLESGMLLVFDAGKLDAIARKHGRYIETRFETHRTRGYLVPLRKLFAPGAFL